MKEVRWIIEKDLGYINDLKQIQTTCEALGVPFEVVPVKPFVTDLPEFTLDSRINIYYGSTSFVNQVYCDLWAPIGVFFDQQTFSMANYLHQWGKHMLNSDAEVTTLAEFTSRKGHPDYSLWFIRPDGDNKTFNGEVKSFKEICNWKQEFTQYDNSKLDENTPIIVGPPYNVRKEWRNYVVNGKIVSSTLYRQNFRLKKSSTDIPEKMLEFANKMLDIYQPSDSFALDIALCGGEYFIIECGCINCCGFYAADIPVIIKAITKSVQNS